MSGAAPRRYERYVAIGDSSTEGLNDPDGRGGFRGWSERLAERIAAEQGGLLYANLAIRGRTTRRIRLEQLDRAAAMRPDLATLFSGTNDVMARHFDAGAVGEDMRHMQRTLIDGGAVVLTFTLPDLTPVMPIARLFAPRIRALNDAMRRAAAASGATLLDFAAYPVATDLRLWSDDRIHANAAGHARIAEALSDALALPGSDHGWMQPLPLQPSPTRVERIGAELAWVGRHVLPWLVLSPARRAEAAARRCKRPELAPLMPPTRGGRVAG